MPRMRMIKPGFFTSDTLAEIEPLGRLLFAGLWCIADREGRLEDRPRKIKAEVLPYDNVDVDQLLSELARRGFLIRYEAGGVRYLQVANFAKHQSPNIKEVPSTIPAPCKNDASTMPTTIRVVASTADTVTDTVSDTETGRTEANASGAASAPRSAKSPQQLPPRMMDEAELTYWQRILKEAKTGTEQIAILVRMAHEKIGVPLEQSSYARMGKLAKERTSALMAKDILAAAANHIDGHPLDYLQALITRSKKQRQEPYKRADPPGAPHRLVTAKDSNPFATLPDSA